MSETLPDPSTRFPWLGEIHGERATGWAAERSAETDAALDTPEHGEVIAALTEALDAEDRLVAVSKHGAMYTNFWQDAEHPRGLWRTTTWESYRSGDPEWEVLLDVDELAAREGPEWVWAGAAWCPAPDGSQPTRVLVSLSPDGGDAVRVREFDVATRDWAERGFDLPVAKTEAEWAGPDELLVGVATGPDDTTRSSYARTVRRLRRGMPLDTAPVVFEVDAEHVAAWAGRDHTPGFERDVAEDLVDFYHHRRHVDRGAGWEEVHVPYDAKVVYFRQWLLVRPMSEWEVGGQTHPAGSLVVAELDAWLDGERETQRVFTPRASESVSSLTVTRERVLLTVLRDVVSTVLVLDPAAAWAASSLPGVPEFSTVSVWGVDDEDDSTAEDYWMSSSSFLEPARLWRGSLGAVPDAAGSGGADGGAGERGVGAGVGVDSVDSAESGSGSGSGEGHWAKPDLVASAPERFDASGFRVTQRFAESEDGTRVPYFLVIAADDPADGRTPVLISAYGGFRTSLTPGYSATVGLGWLGRRTSERRAPAYVVANLRGGGEYGPDWHAAALRENRVKAFEDLAAVARDLADTEVSAPQLTTIMGRSNGGLLTGNALTRYPELFGGISCGVPLLDMLHYTRLSAGHSWIAEYGDPDDPDDAGFLRELSPLHRLVDHPHDDYPPTLIWTTTSDDRVGPVQARMMAAAMLEDGVDDVWYHEDTTGGHAGSVDHADTARMLARSYTFLWLAATDPERLHRS